MLTPNQREAVIAEPVARASDHPRMNPLKIRATMLLFVATVISGCASRYVDPLSRPLVDTPEAVVRFEGVNVQLVGEVSDTKIPRILGVDVRSDNPDLRGMRAEAYGVLKRFVVTEEEARALNRQMVAHRGAGSFWVLYDPKTKAPAQVEVTAHHPTLVQTSYVSETEITAALEQRWSPKAIAHFCTPERRQSENPLQVPLVLVDCNWQGQFVVGQPPQAYEIRWEAIVIKNRLEVYVVRAFRGKDYWVLEWDGNPEFLHYVPGRIPKMVNPSG